MDLYLRFQSVLGLLAFVLIAWMFSEAKERVRWRMVWLTLVFQLFLAWVVLSNGYFAIVFDLINFFILALQSGVEAGTSFVFGYLGGANIPFVELEGESSFILAFRVFPMIIVMSALCSVLFYLNVLPHLIKSFSYLVEKITKIRGIVSFSAAANVFVGMVEAPLLIRPYLKTLSRSELFMIMTVGMSTIAGTVFAMYAVVLADIIEDAAGHLALASVLSIFSAILISHILIPDGNEFKGTSRDLIEDEREHTKSFMEALTNGTTAGLFICFNVMALLIVMLALVHMINSILGLMFTFNGVDFSLEMLLGWVMAPMMWLTGMNWTEALQSGSLMGVKTVLNELVAYLKLSALDNGILSYRAKVITLYALCGFANLGSLGILTAGLLTMAPERKKEILDIGPKSLVAGTLTTLFTGAIVGVVL